MYKNTFTFSMREYDDDGQLSREVNVTFVKPDGVTHNEVTEIYLDFLKGCGYCFNLSDTLEVVNNSEVAEAELNQNHIGLRFSEDAEYDEYNYWDDQGYTD